jgi:hypothetical protein
MYMNTVTRRKEVPAHAILRAVIIYDEFDSAAHATTLLERAALRTGEAIKWDIKPWQCDVLQQPTLAALTIAVAANADLIVLAVQRTHFPPAELLDWLKNWAQHRRIEDAAVLTLHADIGSHRSKAWNEIKAFLEQHHLTFLGSHQLPTHKHSTSFIHRWHQHKQLAAPSPQLLSMDERRPAPRPWEIKE